MSDTKPIPCRHCRKQPDEDFYQDVGPMVYWCEDKNCPNHKLVLPLKDWNLANAPSEAERMMDYLEIHERSHTASVNRTLKQFDEKPIPKDMFLFLAIDDTTCWGTTYREAVRKAMAHDGWGTKQ